MLQLFSRTLLDTRWEGPHPLDPPFPPQNVIGREECVKLTEEAEREGRSDGTVDPMLVENDAELLLRTFVVLLETVGGVLLTPHQYIQVFVGGVCVRVCGERYIYYNPAVSLGPHAGGPRAFQWGWTGPGRQWPADLSGQQHRLTVRARWRSARVAKRHA